MLKLALGERDGRNAPYSSFAFRVRGPKVVVESARAELCGISIDVRKGE